MDFFESQEVARRKTKTLVFYFFLAVVGIVLSIYAAALGGHWWLNGYVTEGGPGGPRGFAWWNPEVFLYSTGVTLLVILLGTGFKTMQLGGGGAL